ncbi:peptidoglycan recognition protein family protein [Umezawaea beigongshangensis]|uniref:peptidoglycan recognition protein family protein n=1 Tax=Umezawaea beigongshangensis TaxID=2780383 RepID=UPI0018F16542|nr:peptidoglycan recognition family protein [Umezawaea beigongshangensis]
MISRRSLFVGAAAGAAGVAAAAVAGPRISSAAGGPAAPAAPQTRRITGASADVAPGSSVVSAANTDYVSVRSAGDVPRRARLRAAGGDWGPWRDLRGCPAGEERGRADVLVRVADADELEVELPEGGTATRIDTVGGEVIGTRAAEADSATIAGHGVGAKYLSRAAWGADESLRFDETGAERYPTAFFPVQTLTVHHTVTDLGDDPIAAMRAIYYTHTITQDFGDIGYHLLIDPAGRVYEGRYSGDDGLPVFDRDLRMSNAAHVGGYNAGNVGVALLGDLTDAGPTAAASRSLVDVLAVLAKVCRIDPLSKVDYVNPLSGATATVDAISGHRDWMATECPGNAFYPVLADVRRRVAARLR